MRAELEVSPDTSHPCPFPPLIQPQLPRSRRCLSGVDLLPCVQMEARERGGKGNVLCSTPFGVDVVGITEFIALLGAITGGITSRQRKVRGTSPALLRSLPGVPPTTRSSLFIVISNR